MGNESTLLVYLNSAMSPFILLSHFYPKAWQGVLNEALFLNLQKIVERFILLQYLQFLQFYRFHLRPNKNPDYFGGDISDPMVIYKLFMPGCLSDSYPYNLANADTRLRSLDSNSATGVPSNFGRNVNKVSSVFEVLDFSSIKSSKSAFGYY